MGPIARSTLRTSAVLGLRLLIQAGTLLVIARIIQRQSVEAFIKSTSVPYPKNAQRQQTLPEE
jgi:hypothetical protein